MRNIFYFLAALLALGVGWFYYQKVEADTATITKLRLKAEDGLVIEAGTLVDESFFEKYVVSQAMPRALSSDFTWALGDDPVTRINLKGRVFGQDVAGGSFLQRVHFFAEPQIDFDLRIEPGNRAFSIPVEPDRGVGVFLVPGSHVDVIGPFVNADDQITTRAILENAIVMAVGEFDSSAALREERELPRYKNITLQAPSAEVEAFLAQEVLSVNDLTLVLRNPCEGTQDCIGLTQ
ncbi:MAG: RcpC/CpaB family pilus assembly protein [Pseudomonadota bacterium]